MLLCNNDKLKLCLVSRTKEQKQADIKFSLSRHLFSDEFKVLYFHRCTCYHVFANWIIWMLNLSKNITLTYADSSIFWYRELIKIHGKQTFQDWSYKYFKDLVLLKVNYLRNKSKIAVAVENNSESLEIKIILQFLQTNYVI